MSFQSFSKFAPPPRYRPKNLPSMELIETLHALCEGTDNYYDSRHHALNIFNFSEFVGALNNRLGRSLNSFEKQLRMAGFRKHKTPSDRPTRQEDSQPLKYYWRARKEDYITRELDFSEKHLAALIAKAADTRAQLLEQRSRLDADLETTLFRGLAVADRQDADKVEASMRSSLEMAKEVVNRCQLNSKDLIRGIETNLDTEISLLRLLVFRQTETHED